MAIDDIRLITNIRARVHPHVAWWLAPDVPGHMFVVQMLYPVAWRYDDKSTLRGGHNERYSV